jgi:hypothetical protein
VWSLNVISCITLRVAVFFALYSFRIWEIQNSIFNETCIKHIKCSLWTCMNCVLYWDCNISFFIYSAKEWARNVGRLCTVKEAGSLHHKFLCWDHFLLTDFITPEGICLNRMAVPLVLDSALHSNPQSSSPLLPTLYNSQPSAVSPQNNNLPVLPPLPLTSELPPEEYNLKVLPPLRTYSKWNGIDLLWVVGRQMFCFPGQENQWKIQH